MKTSAEKPLARRDLLVRTVPACAMACIGMGRAPALAAALFDLSEQEVHKFDVRKEREVSVRDLARMSNRGFIGLIKTLKEELGTPAAIRLLNTNSDKIGRELGETQAEMLPDTSFQTFVAQFRPPAFSEELTHQVVVDTEDVFELRVTECIWASVFREEGVAGKIGHAAVCNMDYAWPTAFNPTIRMERTKTLMQGHDCCNHRYRRVTGE